MIIILHSQGEAVRININQIIWYRDYDSPSEKSEIFLSHGGHFIITEDVETIDELYNNQLWKFKCLPKTGE